MRRSPCSLLRALVATAAVALVAALSVAAPRPPQAVAAGPAGSAGAGYWLAGGDGSVSAFGAAADLGSLEGRRPARPVTGLAGTPTGAGYWMVAADGGIFSFGDAAFYGSTGAIHLNQPIVGLAATPTGHGYWFVAADGGIFSFGDAAFYGSTGARRLNRPIVGMAASPTGAGYWFVASDGGIFNFGDAPFLGSTGGKPLPAGVIGMAPVGGDHASASGGDDPTTATTAIPAGTGGTGGTGGPTTTTTGSAGRSFQIGLVGDTGYTPTDAAAFDRVVDDMNRFPLAFVVHDGDFKDPPSACTDERFGAAKATFNRSAAPFVYAVGDNEWMDCNNVNTNPNEAPMDSLGRLDELRELFFPDDESLGQQRMPLVTQRQRGFPENARWERGGVVFATLNAPGPSDDVPNTAESRPRRLANQAWLEAAFDRAESTGAAAVMIIWQADPWYVTSGGIDFRPTWRYLTDVLNQRAAAFKKPVVLVHGDTHIYRIDNPFAADPDGDGPQVAVPNFTRVETHATKDPDRWVRVTVDPTDPKVFTFADEQAG